MKAQHLLLMAAAFMLLSGCMNGGRDDKAAADELLAATQDMLDAIAPGDKSVWERRLADDFLLTDEEGNRLGRDELLVALQPLPEGYVGSLRATQPIVRVNGDTAIVSYRADETLAIHGQRLDSEFQTTETWIRRDDEWRLLASHVTVIPAPRPSVAVDPETLDDYAGVYALAPDVTYTVTVKDGALVGQRNGRAEETLAPSGPASFFKAGTWRGEKIFVRDDSGKVASMIDRRDNRDLVWKRID